MNNLKSWTGGIRYPGFNYFPRRPEQQKDPPLEPTKLLMVQRVKPFKGNAYWLKRILCEFKLDEKGGGLAIVKNIPEVNSRLYKIKHLIKITPIRTPDGVPDDPSMGYLRDDGVFVVSKKLKPDSLRLKLTEDFQTDPVRLDPDTIKKQARDKWLNPW
ncbi:mitochondrial ribosomal protein L30 isoform X2 [Rhodnius prolixus]